VERLAPEGKEGGRKEKRGEEADSFSCRPTEPAMGEEKTMLGNFLTTCFIEWGEGGKKGGKREENLSHRTRLRFRCKKKQKRRVAPARSSCEGNVGEKKGGGGNPVAGTLRLRSSSFVGGGGAGGEERKRRISRGEGKRDLEPPFIHFDFNLSKRKQKERGEAKFACN